MFRQDGQTLLSRQERCRLDQEIIGFLGRTYSTARWNRSLCTGPDLDDIGSDLAAEGRNQPAHLVRIHFPVDGDAIDQRNREGQPGGLPPGSSSKPLLLDNVMDLAPPPAVSMYRTIPLTCP